MFRKKSKASIWHAVFSSVSAEVLRFLAEHPDQVFHEREVARKTGVSSAGAHQALKVLRSLGLVHREHRGRMYLYRLQEDRALVRALKAFLTVLSLEPLVRGLAPSTSRVILYGSAVRGEQSSESDIDLLVVSRDETRVRNVVKRLGGSRPFQVIVKTPEEWMSLEEKDPEFASEVLRGILLWERPVNESAL